MTLWIIPQAHARLDALTDSAYEAEVLITSAEVLRVERYAEHESEPGEPAAASDAKQVWSEGCAMTKPANVGTGACEEVAPEGLDMASSGHRSRLTLTAADIMSRPVLTISVGETLWDAWSLLYRSGLRHLVVVDGSRCVGVIDDRRIALEWPLSPSRDLARRVGQIITGRTWCVTPDTTAPELARIMLRGRLGALPVVTPTGDLTGLVSASDLLLVLASQDCGR